jgi:biopolymer transport protein ExbD
MKLQVRRAEEVELNLVSLVDVVLLLVIFFMLSTTFVQDAHLRVALPEAGSATLERTAQPIVITVSAQGSYRVNDRALVNTSVRRSARRCARWQGNPGKSRSRSAPTPAPRTRRS